MPKVNEYNKRSLGGVGSGAAGISLKEEELLPGKTVADTPAGKAKPDQTFYKRDSEGKYEISPRYKPKEKYRYKGPGV